MSSVAADNYYSLSFLAISIAIFVFWQKFYSISKKKIAVVKTTSAASGGSAPIAEESKTISTDCHGVKVRHPQVHFESQPSEEWLAQQHSRTETILGQLKTRSVFKKRLKKSLKYESLDTPIHIGGRYFYSKRSGRRNQRESIYYWTNDVRSEGTVVLDPNTFFGDDSGNNLVLGTWVSDDGEMFAFAYISTRAQDHDEDHDNDDQYDVTTAVTVKVIAVSTAEVCPLDTINGLNVNSLNISWVENHTGFFYTRFAPPPQQPSQPLSSSDATGTASGAIKNATKSVKAEVMTPTRRKSKQQQQQICFHRMGTDPADDLVIFEGASAATNGQQQLYYSACVTADGHFLLIEAFADEDPYYRNSTTETAGNMLYMMDLTHFDGYSASTVGQCVNFVESLAWRWEYVYNVDDNFWFRTNFGAPGFRVVRVSIRARVTDGDSDEFSTEYGDDDKECDSDEQELQLDTASDWGAGSGRRPRAGGTRTGTASSQDSDMEDYSDDDNDSGFENGNGLVVGNSSVSSRGAKLRLLASSKDVAKGSGWKFLEVLTPPPTPTTPASDGEAAAQTATTAAAAAASSISQSTVSSTVKTTVTLGAYGFIEWIPAHHDGAVLESAAVAAFTVLVLKYIAQGTHEVILYDLSENLDKAAQTPIATLPHPDCGTIVGPSCFYLSNDVYYGFSSFSDPNSIYRAVIKRDLFARSTEISFDQVYGAVIRDFDSLDYDTVKVMCPLAKDRGSLPLYIFGSRHSLRKRSRPCILHVRDSFHMPPIPTFSPEVMLFVKHFGGLFCVADFSRVSVAGNARNRQCGGSTKRTAQRVDDLMHIAKFLQEGSNPYCERDMLGLLAESSGSITAAACINKKSELFAAAVIECGMFDLMRYPHIQYGTPDGPSTSTNNGVDASQKAATSPSGPVSVPPAPSASGIAAPSVELSPLPSEQRKRVKSDAAPAVAYFMNASGNITPLSAKSVSSDVSGIEGDINTDGDGLYGPADGLRHRKRGVSDAPASATVSITTTTATSVGASRVGSDDEDPLDRIFTTEVHSPPRVDTRRRASNGSTISASAAATGRTDKAAVPVEGGQQNGTISTAGAGIAATSSAAITEAREQQPLQRPAEWKMNPWYAELGYAEESAEDAKRLLELSPLHNIEKSDPMDPYPAMLVITWDDAQVSPIHSYKYVAQLHEILAPRPIQVGRLLPLILRDTADDDNGDDEEEEDGSDGENKYGTNWINSSDESLNRMAIKICFLAERIGAIWRD